MRLWSVFVITVSLTRKLIYLQKNDKMHLLDTFAKQELGVNYEVPDVYEEPPSLKVRRNSQGQFNGRGSHSESSYDHTSSSPEARDTGAQPEWLESQDGPSHEMFSTEAELKAKNYMEIPSDSDQV